MNKIAIFPGSFDPITIGHMYVINKALSIFDSILVVLSINKSKSYYFDLSTRLNLLNISLDNKANIEVVKHDGLIIDLCEKKNIKFIIRGIRNTDDFNYENNMSIVNNRLSNGYVTTIFIPCTPNLIHISSSMIRELHLRNKDISEYLPISISNMNL